MRFKCPDHPIATARKSHRLGALASLTASLLLGACSQTSNMLPSLALNAPEETASNPSTMPQSELEKATAYWGKKYEKDNANLQFALNYARDLKAMGEKKKAFAVLQQASVFHKNSRELAGEYGRLALEFGQVGPANELLAVADDPANPDWRVISARGTVMAKQGRYKDAIPFYERALALSQNNATVMNNLAMAYAMLGEPKKAEDLLRQALTEKDAKPKVRENLALVLGLQGRYEESKAVASGVMNSAVASANTEYLKEMVKLEPKNAMPDAKSFAAQTAVARTEPAQPSAASGSTTASSSPRPASSGDIWSTSVSGSEAAMALKGSTSAVALKTPTH
jgi:Flp pilus assembly protein TadD